MGNSETSGVDASRLGTLTEEEIARLVSQPLETLCDDPMRFVLREYYTETQFLWRRWRTPGEWEEGCGVSVLHPSTWRVEEPFQVTEVLEGPFAGTVVGTGKMGGLVNCEVTVKRYASRMSLQQYTALSTDEINTMNEHICGLYDLNEPFFWDALGLPGHRVRVRVTMEEDGVTLHSLTSQQWAVRDNVVYQLVISYPLCIQADMQPIIAKISASAKFIPPRSLPHP